MPKLKGRGLTHLVDRIIVDAGGVTFRFDDANVFEFWLEARYTIDELLAIAEEVKSYQQAHPEEVKVPKPQLFTG